MEVVGSESGGGSLSQIAHFEPEEDGPEEDGPT